MSLVHLTQHWVKKPWGRSILPPPFDRVASGAAPVGEIHFVHPADPAPPLLVKYLFASDRLSVQVHPDDAAAHARGLPWGKDEAWYIVDADPEATIGIGLTHAVTKDDLRRHSIDGSVAELLDWRPVQAGDTLYAPAGTVHAIGAGVSVVEFQQNLDVTYRLYDYGSDRELQLDDAVDVANPLPLSAVDPATPLDDHRTLLVDARAFRLEKWIGPMTRECAVRSWLVPLAPGVTVDDEAITAGSVSIADHGSIKLDAGAILLVASVSHPAL